MSISINELNAIPGERAESLLTDCCGSSRWVQGMVAARPFESRDAVFATADRIWRSLGPTDFLEAFAHHPRIGDSTTAVPQGEQGSQWSAKEQSGLDRDDSEMRAALSEVNTEYERRFGYIYVVCAAGKSGSEMLDLARSRLRNDAETELTIAAEEQRKITRLRLEKLLALSA